MTTIDPITRLNRASFKWNMIKGKNAKPEARTAAWAELIDAATEVATLDRTDAGRAS